MNQIYEKENIEEIIIINAEKRKVTIDQGSDVNVISRALVKTLGLSTEKINEIELKIFKGVIERTSERVKMTLSYKEVIMKIGFLLINSEDPETIILGKKSLNEIDNKINELNQLKLKFTKIFDNKPSEGYDGYLCPIHTKPGNKVNVCQPLTIRKE